MQQLLLAGLIMLLPTMLMGATFPLACKIYTTGTDTLAAGVGDVYASNTLGAIVGSSFTGIILITALGLKGGLIIAASLNLLVAVVGLYFGVLQKRGTRSRAVALALLIGALYLLSINVDVVFTERIASQGTEVIFHQEDATGVVEVWQRNGQRFLVTNRLHTEGSDVPNEIYNMRKQGYFPLLLHPRPESVIEIGLGAGVGFVPVVLYDAVQAAEMVEISPGVVQAASYFMQGNATVLHHPKLKLRIDDGRNYLLLTPKRYDLLVLGLFTPYRWGTGYLYSRELYLQARNTLKKGGMVI